MKNPQLKKALPHLFAVMIFLVVSAIFCKPALDGNVLNQHDIIGWKGMAQNAFEYEKKNGRLPLWNPNLFSGMPNYQITMKGKNVLYPVTDALLFTLPKPINFFFWACVCFYILCLLCNTRTLVAVFGALGYAFVTYNPIIINAGHESKMLAIAFMPLVLAGLISIFEKRYWLGIALASFGTYIQIGVNHFQISFYLFLIAVAFTISYIYEWITQKDWKHLLISAVLTVASALLALAGNALTLLTTGEYTAYTMRGGKDVSIENGKVTEIKTKGLDTDYAFQYSLGKAETAVLLMPNAFGRSSGNTLDKESKVVEKLVSRGQTEDNAIQIATSLPSYWGGVDPFSSGPHYVGVITCLLALIGFVLYKKPIRWGLLAVSVLAILMSWGKHLPAFNHFLFHNLPLYNKFRAPSMTLVILQFTLPLMAVLSLQNILFRENSQQYVAENFRKILYAFGGLMAVLGLLYVGMDYSAPIDKLIIKNKWDNSGTDEIGRLIVSGMKEDRKIMFGGQLLRTLAFMILVIGILYAFAKKIINQTITTLLFIFVCTVDLFAVGKQYLNEENYISKEELNSAYFTPSAVDQQILSDKDPNFRVFNLSADAFAESRTSYFHKSVGGYHPAKLRIYQDVIEKYLSVQHPEVLNMLNTKYFISRDPKTGQEQLLRNPNAYGNCWLVKNIRFVNNRAEALVALGNTNLKETAIIEKTSGKNIIPPLWDSASYIRLTKFDNDTIEYEANCNGPQFAVFSEIYYPAGWNVYINGEKRDYVNANYILRGLSLPQGNHSVRFVFEPATYKKGNTIGFIASQLILLFFVGGLYMAQRKNSVQK